MTIHYVDITNAQSLLAVSPRIAQYVREIHCYLEFYLCEQNPVLAMILRMLPDLLSLTINGRHIDWAKMGASLQSAVMDISRTLRSLSLVSIRDIPPSFICLAFSAIESFAIDNITIHMTADTSAMENHAFTPRTQNFMIRNPNPKDMLPDLDYILRPRTPHFLDNIQRLMVGLSPDVSVQSYRLMSSTASTLHSLRLRCGGFLLPLDLPHLPALRLIELKVYLGYHIQLPQTLYSALATFPTAVPSIEVVKLSFYRAYSDPWVADRVGPLPVLNSFRTMLPRLRQVVCHLYLTSRTMPHADFISYIEGKLPGLRGTHVLTLSHGLAAEEAMG
ncbi:hypothetical protein FB451DRAFT_1270599 [Mycena latifolia]|nr:hypothetical protein FB451DRAFT_1270599 [Mycena latifolia]